MMPGVLQKLGMVKFDPACSSMSGALVESHEWLIDDNCEAGVLSPTISDFRCPIMGKGTLTHI